MSKKMLCNVFVLVSADYLFSCSEFSSIVENHLAWSASAAEEASKGVYEWVCLEIVTLSYVNSLHGEACQNQSISFVLMSCWSGAERFKDVQTCLFEGNSFVCWKAKFR